MLRSAPRPELQTMVLKYEHPKDNINSILCHRRFGDGSNGYPVIADKRQLQDHGRPFRFNGAKDHDRRTGYG